MGGVGGQNPPNCGESVGIGVVGDKEGWDGAAVVGGAPVGLWDVGANPGLRVVGLPALVGSIVG